MKGIQKAINGIEADAEEANWELRMEILQILLGSSQSIAAKVRQEGEPNIKTVKKTVPIPKVKQIKNYIDEPKQANSISKPMDDAQRLKNREQQLQAIKPYATR
jgi:putative N-acetylmannosamine-6-phosphate epimerase